MKPIAYVTSVFLILFVLMLALGQLPKTPAPRLAVPALAPTVEIHWGEGMEVKSESKGPEDTLSALK